MTLTMADIRAGSADDRDAGALAGLTPAQRAVRRSPEQGEIEWLRARAERAEAELAETKAALEVVGKHTRS